MAQNNSGWVVGAVVVGVIAVAGASGAFSGPSTTAPSSYPVSYASQAGNGGYVNGMTQPTQQQQSNAQYDRMIENECARESDLNIAAIQQEQAQYKADCRAMDNSFSDPYNNP